MLESTIYMKNACDMFVAKNVLFTFIYMWKAPGNKEHRAQS